MNFQNRWLKIASYIFMGFITLIIVLSFGMPDFLGSSAMVTDDYVAKVGSEVITKRDVAVEKRRVMDQYGLNDPGMETFIEGQAIETLIRQKVFSVLSREAGFEPVGKAVNVVLASGYKKYFPEFMSTNGFDFKKFDDYLRKSGRSRIEMDSLIVDSRTLETADTLFRSLAAQSPLESDVLAELDSLQYSVTIAIFAESDFARYTAQTYSPSESEITAEFESEYIKKDSKATMTPIIREGIILSLRRKREASMKGEIEEKMSSVLASSGMPAAVARFDMKTHSFQKVSLSKDLDSAKPADWPSLAPLESSSKFDLIFTKPTGTVSGPFLIGKNIFILRNDGMEKSATAKPAAGGDMAMIHWSDAFETAQESIRKSAKVERFGKKPVE